MMIAVPLLALALAVALLLAGVDPVPTWFYVFAWYPTLVLLDALARRLDGRALVFKDATRVASLCAWSAVIWLAFEAANFRLDNWYYVFLPRNEAERWVGILLSFATVVPAILLAERALDAAGVGRRWRTQPVRVRSVDLQASMWLGAGQLALALAWPRIFFPLIWAGWFLLLEPYVYRRRPDLSLFADFSRGEWGRAGRIFVGGLGVGLLWESYNYWARGKWVYTVPWLEGTKWFEMPPVGFIGFPFFALEAWAIYHTLCAAGVALPLAGPIPHRRRRMLLAGLLAVPFSVLTLAGMEHWTVSSVVPKLSDLPGYSPRWAERLAAARVRTPFELAAREPDALAEATGLSETQAQALIETARLATLHGIGADHVARLQMAGVASICALAREDPRSLWLRVRAPDSRPGNHPTAAEVRVWVGAAKRACRSEK